MSISLYDHQRSALEKMKNGCILCGGVGSGKSRTALAYYYLQQGGNLDIPDAPMKNPLDIYIITTARKRDTCEWGMAYELPNPGILNVLLGAMKVREFCAAAPETVAKGWCL